MLVDEDGLLDGREVAVYEYAGAIAFFVGELGGRYYDLRWQFKEGVSAVEAVRLASDWDGWSPPHPTAEKTLGPFRHPTPLASWSMSLDEVTEQTRRLRNSINDARFTIGSGPDRMPKPGQRIEVWSEDSVQRDSRFPGEVTVLRHGAVPGTMIAITGGVVSESPLTVEATQVATRSGDRFHA